MPSPATVPGCETGAEPAEGHSQREAAGDGQLVAPLDGPILLPLDPRDGSGRLLRGYFIPVERKLLAAERSRASAVWVVTRPSGSAKRERAEHGRAGKDTTPRKKNTHRGKTLQETVKKFRADVNPASSSSCLATRMHFEGKHGKRGTDPSPHCTRTLSILVRVWNQPWAVFQGFLGDMGLNER